jgi:hypothetical protein
VDGAHHHDAKRRLPGTGDLHVDRSPLHGSADGLGVGIAGADDQRRERRAQDPVQSDFVLAPESLDEPDEPESEEPEELELPEELSVFEVAVSFGPSFEPSFEAESPPPPPRARP